MFYPSYEGCEKKTTITQKMKIIVLWCLIAQMKRFDALITTQNKPSSLQSTIPEKKSRKSAKNDRF